MENKIIQRLKTLGFKEFENITHLNKLQGSFVNHETALPNGFRQKILNDDAIYYGCEVEPKDGDKCFGIAADENQIAIFRYGCGGSDSELICWLKLD